MAADWYKEALGIGDEIKELRRSLHRRPETGNREFATAALIEEYLGKLGIGTKRLCGTGVIGTVFFGKPGPMAALRSDIDALPMDEQTGCPFSSLNDGAMHACGHDVHMAAALGCAKLLTRHKDELSGSVRFIFQPDEEGNGGARRLIAQGAMEGVTAVFGMHVAPELPYGIVGVRYGKFYAASDMFYITVNGKSCHGARPEEGIDALYAAALLTERLHALPKETLPDKTVVSVCRFNSGSAINIIAGKAGLDGIIRTLGPDNRSFIKRRFEEIIDSVEKETGVNIDINTASSHEGVVNTYEETLSAEKSAAGIFGKERVIRIEEPTMTSEDFGFYIDEARGSYYHLGVGGAYGLHNPHFLPPEDTPVLGSALHAAVLTDYLEGCQNAGA